ncbi:Polysaccharide polymerase [Mannheimia sp. USDA-ARS-USMARC-1261]|uniref:oligosaccharide repeat unit polymerase n=1 Tax=Mannheimia sp. USDA-ARS-USMARC-1261 TaxID=1432056 RepID=UPI0003E368C3|nr:oligosaccharide repeat unit polymerase [Mannheimia sp. USDA-ARS-USMARC-1261]AHG74142.1 Polysaccharide polymerase [Mannheimia sp. USDA-ARS-USMARC-1261]
MGHILVDIFEKGLYCLFLVALISGVLLYQVRRFNLGVLIDSINFFWIFTFGTSYAIVIFLFLNSYISTDYFYIILLYYIVISFGIWLGYQVSIFKYRYKFRFFSSNVNFPKREISFLISIYFLLLIFYISKVDFSVFFISRFEANSGGLGIISRYMDVIRLFIIAYAAIIAFNKRSWGLYIALLLFSIASSFINGAKFAIIESIYTAFISIILYYSISFKIFTLKRFFLLLIISFAVLVYVAYFLDRMASDTGMVSKYTDYPVWFEALLLRIVANADMYYLSLPDGIIDIVQYQVSSWSNLFLRPLIGGSLTESLTGVKESISVGRAIWLYHYPDSLSGGSVEHFDLDAYVHFGVLFGVLYVLAIGIYIGFINKIKMRIYRDKNRKNILFIMFFSYMYNKSYILLLSPTSGFSLIVDGFVVISLMLLYLGFINYVFIGNNSRG